MKRLLLLSVCLMLVGAVSAQAGFLASVPILIEQDGPATLSATISAYSSSLDQVTINITGITGGSYIAALEGVFTVGSTDGNGGFAADGVPGDDLGQGSVAQTPPGNPQTWLHYPSDVAALSNGNPAYFTDTGQSDPGSGFELYSAFADAFYSTTTTKMPRASGNSAQTLLATFFVSDATTTSITFGPEAAGPSGTFDSAVGIYDGATLSEHFTFGATTPEPSTLVLLASGLVGLLCYAWRKRK